ncbi:GTPase Era [Asticcacaulis excentricus]|uniref:GTPase Era n=1 Tax=Asticcacaulis excentricus (strain ATCC 15261 / DSM 4724 / KCTC 12464 / NCIMB 9791 / VKM B-1370 / CB 48) TaxID=573065 RepID=E8RSX6_ASTEC|nr:GTPase Era [Asticcacaulis excentricus]ADU14597.1 GTP-binding protein Era [Asticcacaulis excentricus CB 48]
MTITSSSPATTRAGFAAIIGAPNAGKSTLVNALVGSKVSIVTQKVQTTRFPVRGIAIHGKAQIVLVDTPGIFKPRRRLDRAMVKSAWGGAEDADIVVMLIDAPAHLAVHFPAPDTKPTGADKLAVEDAETIIAGLKANNRRAILVLNKIDLLRRDNLLALADSLFKEGVFDQVFMISAEKGNGISDLMEALADKMPSGPWLYPEDQAADAPVRILAAEITREKLFLRVHEELPYACAVVTTDFKDMPDGAARIEQTIFVERDGQRAIVLGKNGQTLKWIGQRARQELMDILDRKVHLFLHVQVNERWSDDRALYAQFGLEFGE